MDIEKVPELIQDLSKRIDDLTYALLLAGICPQCGAKTKAKTVENGQAFTCSCGLQHWLSNKALSNIRTGKDVTAGE